VAKPKLGTGERFSALKSSLAERPGVRNPGALAAYIGRQKYGASKMAKMASHGKGNLTTGHKPIIGSSVKRSDHHGAYHDTVSQGGHETAPRAERHIGAAHGHTAGSAAHGYGSGPIPPQTNKTIPPHRVPDGPNIGDEHHAHHPNMHKRHPDHHYLNRDMD
jgi:hypothetical protein